MKDYGSMAVPLTQLLKDSFNWNDEATTTFEMLKQAMMTLPVLALPDFTVLFTIETDTSGFGVGAVVTQKGRPIAFFQSGIVCTSSS